MQIIPDRVQHPLCTFLPVSGITIERRLYTFLSEEQEQVLLPESCLSI